MTSRPPPTVVPRPSARTRLPAFARLPLLIFLNLALRAALWTAVDNVLGHELGTVSKHALPGGDDLTDLREPLSRLATTVGLVSVAWQLRYDFFDMAALTAIINVPYAFLLITYYNITSLTALAHVANEVIAIALPTYLLRPITDVNNPTVPIRNRYLLNSSQVSLSNIVLALGVYTATLYSALQTDTLTMFLIQHFELPSVESAHASAVLPLTGKLLVAAVATKAFLLNPSIAATPDTGSATPVVEFEPATATLPQTLKHNVWFFSRRTRTLIQRTSILSLFLVANTVSKCTTLEGSEILGSVGYSAFWVVAAATCGAWYVWTGDAEL